MDPETRLKEMREAVKNKDKETATQHACNLFDWVNHGGFIPSGLEKETLLHEVTDVISGFSFSFN